MRIKGKKECKVFYQLCCIHDCKEIAICRVALRNKHDNVVCKDAPKRCRKHLAKQLFDKDFEIVDIRML